MALPPERQREFAMGMMTEQGYALASSQEEVVLRRKLLFRLLRDFDFSRPRLRGEFITDPVRPATGNRPQNADR